MDGSNPQDQVPAATWPECPECRAPRQTFCPGCGTAGIEFPRADWSESGSFACDTRSYGEAPAVADFAPWLICPTCDDAFIPKFYRRCAQCGHLFTDGIDVGGDEPFYDFNARVAGVAAAIAAAAFLIGLIFWWALQ